MDTPERNQIGTSLSKFEDSPVFNYINSLSPIKSVKSLHITQAFSSISFASLPSIFTSPHVSAHKESRFLLRHGNSDPSKPECSSENESGNKVCTSEGVVTDATKQHHKSAVLHENCDLAITVGEASPEADNDYSNFVIELPRCLKYDCGSPNCESTPSGNKVDSSEELADQSASLVPFVVETSEKGPSDVQAQVQGMCEIEQKQEPALCGWEGLNCDASDMLIFNSPNSTETLKGLLQTSLEPVTRFCNSLMPEILQKEIYNEHQMHSSDLLSCDEQQETEDPSSQPGEAVSLEQIEQLQGTIAITCSSNGVSSERTDNEAETCTAIACKSVLNLHRGLRRRCLDFEMAGARKRNLGDAPNTSISLQSNEKTGLNDRQVVQIKPGSDSRCTLPGIGLHLNALALNSKDQKITNNEILSSGRHSLILSPTALSYSNTADQEPLQKSITSDCSEGDTDAAGNGVQLMHDACQAQPFLASEDFNHNSPKKKRRKLDNIGDNDVACKRCNCKKSKCLKLYCECFAAGVYCIEPCSCQDCFNKPIHEDTVLATRKQIESRNPLAFAPKVIRSSDSVPEFGDESSKTPASSRHKRGCNCKKSNCLKKYCECYQGGVGCSVGCRCEGCKNAFGRKDGSSLTGIEAELDEDETEACEKDKPSRKLEILNNGEQNPASSVPMTPLRLSRQLGTLPFSSKGKLPGSSFLTITSSSRLYGGQKLGQPNVLQSQLKFEKQMQTAPEEDEMLDILRGECSPSTGIKTSSPNSKRISPPQCDFGSSPSRKSGRKLILQSIPSFPSLTQQ